MAKLQWALTCQRILTDRDSNTVSYIDAVEELNVSEFPAAFPPVYLASLWKRSKPGENLLIRFRFEDPNGKPIGSKFEPDVRDLPVLRHRVNLLFGGFAVLMAGEYRVLVEQRVGKKWQIEAELGIDVQLSPAEKAPSKPKEEQGTASRHPK